MSIAIPQASAAYDRTRIIERPDGFYWQDKDSGEESGPFATLVDAAADMESGTGECRGRRILEEAESEIGIADWIDPETGQPAEESIPISRITD